MFARSERNLRLVVLPHSEKYEESEVFVLFFATGRIKSLRLSHSDKNIGLCVFGRCIFCLSVRMCFAYFCQNVRSFGTLHIFCTKHKVVFCMFSSECAFDAHSDKNMGLYKTHSLEQNRCLPTVSDSEKIDILKRIMIPKHCA